VPGPGGVDARVAEKIQLLDGRIDAERVRQPQCPQSQFVVVQAHPFQCASVAPQQLGDWHRSSPIPHRDKFSTVTAFPPLLALPSLSATSDIAQRLIDQERNLSPVSQHVELLTKALAFFAILSRGIFFFEFLKKTKVRSKEEKKTVSF
jgi:hypothetical protein